MSSCLYFVQRKKTDDRGSASKNRRLPVRSSAIATKWARYRKSMNTHLQAQHFATYGQSYKLDACNRLLNLTMIKDAMRQCLDREEYQNFSRDVDNELKNKDDVDGMRCEVVHIW